MKKNNHQEQTICFGGCIEYVNILLSKNIETDDFMSLYTLELSNSGFLNIFLYFEIEIFSNKFDLFCFKWMDCCDD